MTTLHPNVETVTRQQTSDELEFARRRNLPHVDVRMMPAGRSWTVVLSYCGREIGSKTELLKRGKPVSTLYVLPPLPEMP